MGSAVFETVNLTRHFGPVCALADVSVAVPRGRIVALLGPNGAGKTTLLKLLLGHLESTSGEAYLFGEPSRTLPASTAGRVVSLLDGHEPPRWASVGQLLRLQAAASPGFDVRAAEAMLAVQDLGLRQRYGRMSKGQRRHVLTSLCLASNADLLLLDEPADGLDTATRRDLYDRVRERVNERDVTMLIATHNIHDIERVADDILVLVKGTLVLAESLERLREQVREVLSPVGAPAPDFPEGAVVLHRNRSGGLKTFHVRLPKGRNSAIRQSALSEDTEEHFVDLESLYLALSAPTREVVS